MQESERYTQAFIYAGLTGTGLTGIGLTDLTWLRSTWPSYIFDRSDRDLTDLTDLLDLHKMTEIPHYELELVWPV